MAYQEEIYKNTYLLTIVIIFISPHLNIFYMFR